MLIVENHINVVGEDELDNDSREVFKEDKETVEAILVELRAWILSSAHLKDKIFFNMHYTITITIYNIIYLSFISPCSYHPHTNSLKRKKADILLHMKNEKYPDLA